jgi:hypothetical protein
MKHFNRSVLRPTSLHAQKGETDFATKFIRISAANYYDPVGLGAFTLMHKATAIVCLKVKNHRTNRN